MSLVTCILRIMIVPSSQIILKSHCDKVPERASQSPQEDALRRAGRRGPRGEETEPTAVFSLSSEGVTEGAKRSPAPSVQEASAEKTLLPAPTSPAAPAPALSVGPHWGPLLAAPGKGHFQRRQGTAAGP